MLDRALILRAGGLYVPFVAAGLLWYWRRPAKSEPAGLLLAALWNYEVLTVLTLLAARFGWWSFHASGGIFLGAPVDLLLGWAVLWGIVAPLAFPDLPIVPVAAIFLALDLEVMPVAQLGDQWLVGEMVAIVFALVPSLWLARWTRDATHLHGRAGMQVLLFSGLTVGVLPAVILARTGGDLRQALGRAFWVNGLLLQVLAVIGILGLSAVQEFAVRGRGTPLPYDPPRKLVTSGAYSYVANPMQLSAMLLMAGWGWFLGNWWVAAAGVMAHIYSAGLAAWNEKDDVSQRFGDAWSQYRKEVRAWVPRWRPWHRSLSDLRVPRARLYVAETCGPCSEVKRWFEARQATALEIIPAEEFSGADLRRVTYVGADGDCEEGLAALARGLEHIHFGWAMLSFAVRLPGVCQLLQLLADASAAGPVRIHRRPGASLLDGGAHPEQPASAIRQI